MKRRVVIASMFIEFILLTLIDEQAAFANTIYVRESATGTGASWTDACGDLQNALDAAVSDDEIWVATGSYKPSVEVGGTGDRYRTFQLKNAVAIYGGFAGNEPNTFDLDDRNFETNETILSGDIGIQGNDADNCYHVFYHPSGTILDTTAILDGVTITAGNADGTYSPHQSGAGMYNYNVIPTLSNCTFTDNSADYVGGGMRNYYRGPAVIGCSFSSNTAGNSGGGMYNLQCDPTVIDCAFTDNFAAHPGGAMYNPDRDPTVTGCTFNKNLAKMDGGGMCNENHSSPTLTNCIFSGNSADYFGGGMLNDISWPTVTGCTFAGNSATNSGGGMGNTFSSNSIVTNCTFTGNSAGNGGGLLNSGSNPTVSNCIFTANLADLGGGICNVFDSPTVSNCIIWDNNAPSGGDEIFNISSTPVISYCDIKGGYSGGTNIIDTDPMFVDPNGDDNIPGTKDDNLLFSADSPCIDAGDNGYVPADIADLDNDGNTVEQIPFDLNGFPRFIDDICVADTGNGISPVVDMGAYEFLRSDIDSNGDVNFNDFSKFTLYWLDIDCGVCGGADLTCDRDVNGLDLNEFAVSWLEGTAP